MEVLGTSYMPGDPRLVEQLVHELKSQGIFDQFRKECIADVDTKPAYQNLRQRVEGSVTTFLSQQTWRPDMIKNQLREQLRKNIHESGYLDAGVERIVEQVVNPKINTVILPQVEDVAYRFLGIEKPYRDSTKQELNIAISDLLPKDLEAVSPDSVHSFKYDEKMRDSENMNDSLNSNSKADEDESPPFELLIESNHKNESLPLEDNSVDSHLSGFSGLQSHESNHYCDSRVLQTDLSNLESRVSQNDSSNRSSIIISNEDMKMDICEDSLSLNGKSEADELKLNMMKVDNHENNGGYSIDMNIYNDASDFASDSTEVGDNSFSQKGIIKELKKEEKKSATEKKYDKNNDDISSKGSDKHVSKEKKDKYNKSSNNKDLSKSSKGKYKRDSKSSTSSTKDKDKKDKYKEKSSKSDKHSKEKSSKDKEKSKDTVDRKKECNVNEKPEKESDSSVKGKEKDKPENTHEHDKNREKNRPDKTYDLEKSDKDRDKLDKTHDKEKSDKEKNSDKTYGKERSDKDNKTHDKEKFDKEKKSDKTYDKERSDKDKRKSDHCKNRSDKGRADTDKIKEKIKDNEKTHRDSEKSKSKENSEKNRERDKMSSAKSKEKCEKDQEKPTEGDEKLKEKSDKENSSKEKDKPRDKDKSSKGKTTKSSEKSKKEKDIDRERSKSSSSKHKNSSSLKKESTSSDANKYQSSTSSVKEKSKNVENDNSKFLDTMKNPKKEEERKRDPKKQSKDDHYSSKEKKNIRRSTDRDSNDGNSSRNNSTNSSSEASSSRTEKNDNESSSSSGPVDSGNSDDVESSAAPIENNETIATEIIPLKLTKPKFASNFQEARKLMKIRKELVKLEQLNQLNSSHADNVTKFSGTVNMQDISDLPSDSVEKSLQPLKLTKPKFASNFQEAINLMKIRKQLADLEKQNKLKLSTGTEKCVQDTVMEPVVTDNYIQQVELAAGTTAATSTIKPFKLNKPKFAVNFQEARKLMKIRKQLSKLERLNQQNIAAKVVKRVSDNIESGESADIGEINPKHVEIVVHPLKLNKPKFASNFREATKLMKIRKQLSKLEQENKLGFTEVPGTTGNGRYKADKKNNSIAENEADTTFIHKNNGEQSITNHSGNNNENPDPSRNEPLKSKELSQENWEALEARLAQEMSSVNYNCYDESYDYENSESSALNSSSEKCEMRKKTIGNVEVSQGEVISEDSQNDSMEFKGFKLDDNEKNPTIFFEKFLGEESSGSQDLKISDFTVSKTDIDKSKTNEGDKIGNKLHNNFKELSVLLGVNDLKNIDDSAVQGKGNLHSPNECRYLEQQSPSILQNLQYVHKSIEKLERKIEYCKIELQNNIHCRKGQKRKFQECVDLKNNNKAHFEQTTVKKRGRPPGSNSAMTKAAKMCNISDILPNNSFPLPLSPAESEKSNDKKEEDIMVPAKQRRIARASQRYASEDLYKPRLVICRRSRGAKNSN